MFAKNICFAALILIFSTLYLGDIAMASTSMPSLTIDELFDEQAAGKTPFLLDVRRDQEFASGHLKGAVHIPLSDLSSRILEVPKDKPIVVYCRSGARSSRAMKLLMSKGYDNLRNLTGGILAWRIYCEKMNGAC